jgi:hypothetical protein
MIFAQAGLPVNVTDFITDPPIALLIVLLIGAIVGAVKGWWVPKFIYDREVARADKADAANGKVTDALEELTKEIRQRREPKQ